MKYIEKDLELTNSNQIVSWTSLLRSLYGCMHCDQEKLFNYKEGKRVIIAHHEIRKVFQIYYSTSTSKPPKAL